MGYKLYEENDINNIAIAVQQLTGMTERFRVGDIPGIIDAHINPKDMTNVRKVKLTFRAAFTWSSLGMGLGSIRFKNSVAGEYYEYLRESDGTSRFRYTYWRYDFFRKSKK